MSCNDTCVSWSFDDIWRSPSSRSISSPPRLNANDMIGHVVQVRVIEGDGAHSTESKQQTCRTKQTFQAAYISLLILDPK